ncbi:DUF4157 domain-containing protein [Ferruginibacter albus]|uniref:DUF4157 domain-containing protein n=1 Tax=Ferruginibacter albus TaxID=2875540 RepID=UPI001CC46973|nr:DUF4157 domain-containing protein [Ferruginibacter albus]UAY51890.1 DUF4157 domain-containing protein [Ferruginibacter albus]
MENVTIKENSWIAKLAAKRLKVSKVAIVIGKKIHLYNTTQQEFLTDIKWVRHELCHVQQFKQHGFFIFIIKYLLENFRKGYYNNKFEVEARAAENDQ